MSTHVVARLTSNTVVGGLPLHRVYGPCTEGEAWDLLKASGRLLEELGYTTNIRYADRVIAWKKGAAITTIIIVPMLPPTDDVCEGIE